LGFARAGNEQNIFEATRECYARLNVSRKGIAGRNMLVSIPYVAMSM